MSSVVGHLAAGVGVYLCRHRFDCPETRRVIPWFAFAAIAPDFDYFLLWALLAAASSHLLLDLLVKVHSVPVLWPLPIDITLPIGILPSAGQFRIANYYLWRNLLIELGILLPAIALVIGLARATPLLSMGKKALFIFPFWATFLIWSLSLSR